MIITHRAKRSFASAVVLLCLATACSAASTTGATTSAAGNGAAGASGPVVATTVAAAPASPAVTPASAPSPASPARPRTVPVEVVASYPHDRTAFTQGLLLDGDRLFESTGLVGESSLREVDLATGEVLRRRAIGEGYFAEGLALVGNRLIQLTWQSGVALVHDRDSFEPLGRFAYQGEGWGLCSDGRRLVMSDGSARLTFRDPVTFDATGSVTVTDGDGTPVTRLNELECVGDAVYANVWMTDRIARIDPASGRVTAWIDAAALRPPNAGPQDVLNGIAFDERDGTFLVTGKRWPTLYRVRLPS